MKVVANASVFIGLSSIGWLALLHERFPDGVLIPRAVWREVVEQGGERPGARGVAEANWITVRDVAAREIVQLLEMELEEGEAEAIALALGQQADLVLLDESEARKIAKLYGLLKTGVVGVLIRAKREGKVQSLQAELNKLQHQAGFWIEERIYHQALRAVGEE